MSNTLYRKYRPQKFSEIIGQQHIVQTLSNAIKHNRIGQAYLFTGPRGTGKTTVARVFAKAVNCAALASEERAAAKASIRRSDAKADEKGKEAEPCGQCPVCKNISEGKSLDIIEIDAASNTGVDNIRELRETVKLPPTQAKYKVYIIDEVHMLSAGAFNALLKTLEEPPSHVIFILATTEIHKVPETIISRCQRFDFARLTLEQIIEKLSNIAKKEKVEIEKDALEMIAISAEGGMRDAESLLAQIITLEDKNITSKEVEEILGSARRESVAKMATLILSKKTHEALDLVSIISKEGIDFEVFHKSLLNYLRQMMIISVSPDLSSLFRLEIAKGQLENMQKEASNYSSQEILGAIEILIEAQKNIRSSFIPQLPLEMAIVKVTQQLTTDNLQQITNFPASPARFDSRQAGRPTTNNDKTSIPVAIKDNGSPVTPEKKDEIKNTDGKTEKKVGTYAEIDINEIKKSWQAIITATKPLNHSLMALLSNCVPVKNEDGTAVIATKYGFYKDKLNEKINREIVENVIFDILKARPKIRFITEEEAGIKINPEPTKGNLQQPAKENGSLLDDALSIMGGKIVDE